eukprot:205994-Prymnesium_polylepis.1
MPAAKPRGESKASGKPAKPRESKASAEPAKPREGKAVARQPAASPAEAPAHESHPPQKWGRSTVQLIMGPPFPPPSTKKGKLTPKGRPPTKEEKEATKVCGAGMRRARGWQRRGAITSRK